MPSGTSETSPQRRAAEDLGAVAVHGEHLSAVAEAEQVVERDETELARVRRRARDDDTPGMEERPEPLEDVRTAAIDTNRCRMRARRFAEDDQRIDRHGATATKDERIHVDARDIGALGRERPEANQYVRQRIQVGRRLPAKRLRQEPARPEAGDQLVRVTAGERRRGEGDVAEGLREDAAEADDDAGPELGIADDAGDQLAPSFDHLRHEKRDRAVFGPPQRQQLLGSRANGRAIRQAEADQAALGLVGDRVAAELQGHRKAEGLGGTHGIGHVGGQRLARHRHAMAGDQGLGVVLGQGPGARETLGLRHGAGVSGARAGRALRLPRARSHAGRRGTRSGGPRRAAHPAGARA